MKPHSNQNAPGSHRATTGSVLAVSQIPRPAALTHVLVDPATLKPNPANPNKHPNSQLELLAKVIAHQGWRRAPVVSNQSGLLVTGHGSVQAALRAGWKQIPVDDQDFASPEDETAHMLADNKLPELAELDQAQVKGLLADLQSKDVALDLAGFTQDDLADLLGASVAGEPVDRSDQIAEKFEVVVECQNEDQQQEVFTQLTDQGRKCRLLAL